MLKNINNLNSAKQKSNYFFRQKKKKKKKYFTIESAQVKPIYGRKFKLGLNIWEQNTETEKKNGYLMTYGQFKQIIFI